MSGSNNERWTIMHGELGAQLLWQWFDNEQACRDQAAAEGGTVIYSPDGGDTLIVADTHQTIWPRA